MANGVTVVGGRAEEAWFRDVNDVARSTPWLHTPAHLYAVYGVVLFAGLLLLWAGTRPVVTEAGDRASVDVEPQPVVAAGRPSAGTAPAASAERSVVALHVRIEATGRCWITAHADGRLVVSRMVDRGEVVLVDAQSRIRLRLGDAGAVSCTLNGVAGPPLGRPGQPVTVYLTPSGWRLPEEDSDV